MHFVSKLPDKTNLKIFSIYTWLCFQSIIMSITSIVEYDSRNDLKEIDDFVEFPHLDKNSGSHRR